jgi:hypothetical protein
MSFASLIRPRDTLRARLTFWYVSALTLTLSTFAILLYASLTRTLYGHHDHELQANADRVARVLGTAALNEGGIAAALRGQEGLPPFLVVRDASGELLYRSPLLQVAEPSIGHHEALIHAAARATAESEFFTVTLERTGLVRFICTPIKGSRAAYVQVGNPLGDVRQTLHAVAIASAILVPVVVLLTSFGGWLIAGRALAPIGSIPTCRNAWKSAPPIASCRGLSERSTDCSGDCNARSPISATSLLTRRTNCRRRCRS